MCVIDQPYTTIYWDILLLFIKLFKIISYFQMENHFKWISSSTILNIFRKKRDNNTSFKTIKDDFKKWQNLGIYLYLEIRAERWWSRSLLSIVQFNPLSLPINNNNFFLFFYFLSLQICVLKFLLPQNETWEWKFNILEWI